MSIVIGVLSQKGGVGKSMISRLLATEYIKVGWKALIADMDTSQKTSKEWSLRREKYNIQPLVKVIESNNVSEVMEQKEYYDIIIFDGAPHSTRITKQIADISDLIILPTGNSIDDLNPQIKLAYELIDNNVPKKKINFILSRIGTSKTELKDVIDYINQTEIPLLEGYIPEKTAFRQAVREGKTLTETRYIQLTEKCEKAAQAIANKIDEIMN